MQSFMRIVLIVAATAFSTFSYAQYRTDRPYDSLYDSETVASFREQVGYIASSRMEGRAPGSEGEKETAEYIYDRLSAAGADMLCGKSGDEFGIARENGDTLVSRNVIGFVQGYDKTLKDRYIVVGARLDNLGVNHMTVDGKPFDQIYYGANGNASGLAMLTELARMVSTNAIMFRRSVIFVAFGASTEGYAGAWYFLNRSFGDAGRIDAMINLDMLGTGDNGFYAYTASNAGLNAIIGNVANGLQPVRPSLVAGEPYPSDHRAFYSKEIPAVMLTSGKYPEHNTYRDTGSIIDYEMLEKELEYTYNLTLAIANTGTAPAFRPDEMPKRGPSYDDVVSVSDCDVKPMFLNSDDPRQFLQKWVYQYLKYPGYAIENGIQGRVLVDFIIDKDGKVTDVKVIKGVDQVLDDEAVRVISASPKWRPGRLKGNKVRTSMTLPVEFRLEKKGGRPSFGIKK
ncbi:MAG: TonB family protein [Bacteroidales bacterium]|nr:TonB family protein [Bacteroides sp.]MCM1197329.1 TonB family protein [Clostridium sp.]MCM1501853.1 TonB family protein [Bacteroidales bacterium]